MARDGISYFRGDEFLTMIVPLVFLERRLKVQITERIHTGVTSGNTKVLNTDAR